MSIESDLQAWQAKLAEAEQLRADALRHIAELQQQKANQATEEAGSSSASSSLADDLFG